MTGNLELKNSNGRNIQINCIRDFTFLNTIENKNILQTETLYKIIAGEDGSIKVNEEYLPYAVDSNGWLVEIDDVYMFELFSSKENKIIKYIIIVSPAGVIGLYTYNTTWKYKILLESDDCFYEIVKAEIHETKEATLVSPLLSLYINTEFSGTMHSSFSLS